MGRLHRLGPGAIEGVWYWLRRPGGQSERPPLLGYHADVYVDNGYGTHGYVHVTGHVAPNSRDLDQAKAERSLVSDDDAAEALVEEDSHQQVDDLIYSGDIDEVMPGYTVAFEDGPV